jgi:hypothetical protein
MDNRYIVTGREIPTESYSDQPYLMKTDDGAWLCTVTTGPGHEGVNGQHVIALRSTDQGKTWSKPVDVEPGDGPEASYAVMLKVPSGRIYCFYNHNTDNLRAVKADNPPYSDGLCRRVDSLGYYVFKFSDDHGRTWSARRYPIPVREMAIDRENPYGGKVRYFWNVGKPFVQDGSVYVPLIKVGGLGHGFFTRTEGVLLRSANLLSEPDPLNIEWETLPDGDYGLRTPAGGGPIAEEQSYCVLSDGSFYCVYRTVDGHPVEAYSRDGGRSWSEPRYKAFADGRLMKHPRAANFAWRCANGRFLYWFHNHGGRDYEDRNPVWLCGGVEGDSPQGKIIRWTQPEILLYDDDPFVRMSYPDLLEENGHTFVTETQKDIARVHRIDPVLLDGLWNQFEGAPVSREGLLLETIARPGDSLASDMPMPRLPAFCERDYTRLDFGMKDLRQGFSLELWVCPDGSGAGQVLLDNRDAGGRGFCLQTASTDSVELLLNDGQTETRWMSDLDAIRPGKAHHVVAIVDGGPKLIMFVIDGRLCDGGAQRPFGWGRFSPHLRQANGAPCLRIAPGRPGTVGSLRVYGRALRISEAVAHFMAGIFPA